MVEPVSYVVLDVLPTDKLAVKGPPAQFRADTGAKEISFNRRKTLATRVSAALKSGEELDNFRLMTR
jgi:hypothetical protein